jgi:Mor family transcriptional regulator
MTETWKPIPEYEGYEASDLGRIRSYWGRMKGRGNGRGWFLADSPQRILSPSRTAKHYLGVNLQKNGEAHYRRVADLVLLAFIGPRPSGLQVCHGDNNPINNCLSNLRYDTAEANMRESRWAQLTAEQVRAVRQAAVDCANNGHLSKELAVKYCASMAVINNVINWKTAHECGGASLGEIRAAQKASRDAMVAEMTAGEPYAQLCQKYNRARSSILKAYLTYTGLKRLGVPKRMYLQAAPR